MFDFTVYNNTRNGMKKLDFLVVIGFAAWYYHENTVLSSLENLDIKDFKITSKYNSENRF